MRKKMKFEIAIVAALLASTSSFALADTIDWTTVANSGDVMPGSKATFNSFNQPSISSSCLVVFRARSKGPGTPVRGIYSRKACVDGSAIRRIVAVGNLVPEPNNLDAPFTEFPAFPRVDGRYSTIATRGQSQPVYRYVLPDGTETKIGTTGVYVGPVAGLMTGASQLAPVPGLEYFEVPGVAPGTKFDQFPGAPSPTAKVLVTFKGNYAADGVSATGVFYRDISSADGQAPVQLVANTQTRIPNQPRGGTVTFGSTAPPSAAANRMVFLGSDNEDAPTLGGIYLARMTVPAPTALPAPSLRTLVGIGSPVPDQAGATFTKIGEALSYTGRYIGFWGTWGNETRELTLPCPTDGNTDLITYCNQQYPGGYTVQVPKNQGIFVHDTNQRTTRSVAQTSEVGGFADFLYWTFSGRPPGAGSSDGDDLEPARWRSSAFVAVSHTADGSAATAFKASRTAYPVDVDGIYVGVENDITTVLETGTSASAVDPDAPADAKVISVGIERDGFRSCRLTLAAGMLDEATSASWAGIYLNQNACDD